MNINNHSHLPTYEASLLQATAHRKLRYLVSELLKQYDLSLSEWTFLGLVYEHKQINLRTISGLLDVEPPFASRLSRKLLQMNFIEIEASPKDARIKQVGLSHYGHGRFTQIEMDLQRALQDVFIGVPAKHMASYFIVLQYISDTLE